MSLLEIRGLRVVIEGREILHGVDLAVRAGETVVLTGENGAGKSTAGMAVMGLIGKTEGEIRFEDKDISEFTVDERARMGIFMSWQAPVEIEGVSTEMMLRTIRNAAGEQSRDLNESGNITDVQSESSKGYLPYSETSLFDACRRMGVDAWLAKRDLNVGFSGGEKKKNELVQMIALKPKLAILDEVDSGLDREAARLASRVLRDFQKETGVAYLIITHNQWILEELKISQHYKLDSGLVKTGNVMGRRA